MVVLLAVDTDAARMWVTQRTRTMGVSMIEGGFRGEKWNLSVFPNQAEDEPCWACDQGHLVSERLFSCDRYAHQAEMSGFIPATAPGAMALAAWQTAAATAVLHGDLTLANSTVFTNMRAATTTMMRRSQNPDCRIDHRVVGQEATLLQAGPGDNVAALLEEVERSVPNPMVELPASYIRVAPCGTCHKPVLVEQPEWAISTVPLCVQCDGRFAVRPDLMPEQHGSLSFATSESILNTPLQALGLGSGLRLTVHGREDRQTVALNGDVESLVTEV